MASLPRRAGRYGIPEPFSTDPGDSLATSLLCLVVTQAALDRDSAFDHNLRNLVRVRPYKL
jgi:hypothetical protein